MGVKMSKLIRKQITHNNEEERDKQKRHSAELAKCLVMFWLRGQDLNL
jgi:hypothetical protein